LFIQHVRNDRIIRLFLSPAIEHFHACFIFVAAKLNGLEGILANIMNVNLVTSSI
jgi:hypothetical protein